MNLDPEKFEVYLPPPEEIALHEKLEPWAQSLVDRYNGGGFLSILPYDPQRYPFQRTNIALYPAYQPVEQDILDFGVKRLGAGGYELDEVMQAGRETIQGKLLDEQRLGCYQLMEPAIYDQLVEDLKNYQNSPGHTESGLKTLWARMHSRNNNSAVLTRHDHVMDTAIEQVALADAFSRVGFLKTERYLKNFGGFDLFNYSRQNFTNVGMVMSRVAVFGNPVIPLLAKTSNVVSLLPIYRSRDAGIDRKTIIGFNRLALAQAAKSQAELDAIGLSSLDHLAPIGETSKKIKDANDNTVAINSKKVDPSVAKKLVQDIHFLWPVSIYLGTDRSDSRVAVGDMRAIHMTEQVYEIMSQMARTTERLAGIPVYEDHLVESIGASAVSSSY